jgi:phosphate acyltransferase
MRGNNITVGLDAFGSDNAPYPEVEGAIIALKEDICDKILLYGDSQILSRVLNKYFYDKARLEIVHCSERVLMDDAPAKILRQKKDSSLVRLINDCNEGKVQVAVSAGSTGAVMAASLFIYGRLKNFLRPAIATLFPTIKGVELLLDVGANTECVVDNLVQFAEIGSLYTEHFFERKSPRVGLINIGEESSKGNELYKSTYKALSNHPDINFTGNVEGKDLLKGDVDVIVSDGFTGNIILKTVEGAATSMFKILKEQFNQDWISKLGALLAYPAFAFLKKKVDHREYGGALLVGLNGLSVVAHGRSDAKAIKNAVKTSVRMVNSKFLEHAREYYERK